MPSVLVSSSHYILLLPFFDAAFKLIHDYAIIPQHNTGMVVKKPAVTLILNLLPAARFRAFFSCPHYSCRYQCKENDPSRVKTAYE